MLQRVLSSLVSPLGYSLVPRSDTTTSQMEEAIERASHSLLSLHTYKKPDGSFDYAKPRHSRTRSIQGTMALRWRMRGTTAIFFSLKW